MSRSSSSRSLLFGNRDLFLVITLRALSLAATQVISVAVSWQTYVRTGQPLALGYIGLAQFLPVLVLAPLSGTAADRFDRRKLSATASGIGALACLGLIWAGYVPGTAMWPLLSVLMVIASCRIFAFPAQLSLLSNVAPREHLGRAIALGSTANKMALVGGPGLGGLLLAFGANVSYVTAAVMLLTCVAVALSIQAPEVEESKRARVSLRAALGGIPFIFRRPILLGSMSLDLFATLLGGVVALLPIYVHDILRVGPEYLGILRSAPAIGSVLMAIHMSYRPPAKNAGRAMLWYVAIYGMATVAFGLSTHLGLSVVMLLCLGAADMYSTIVRQTVLQLMTPDDMRGRVNAIASVFINASNQLGQFESGLAAAVFGTVAAVVIGGIGSIAVAAVWAWKFPVLFTIDLSERGLKSAAPTVDVASSGQGRGNP